MEPWGRFVPTGGSWGWLGTVAVEALVVEEDGEMDPIFRRPADPRRVLQVEDAPHAVRPAGQQADRGIRDRTTRISTMRRAASRPVERKQTTPRRPPKSQATTSCCCCLSLCYGMNRGLLWWDGRLARLGKLIRLIYSPRASTRACRSYSFSFPPTHPAATFPCRHLSSFKNTHSTPLPPPPHLLRRRRRLPKMHFVT